VDLDVGQGSISVPGTIGSLFIEKPADLVDGFDRRPAYILHYGSTTQSTNMKLYDMLVRQLAIAVKRKCATLPSANIGGYVVNTCGWVKGQGYDLILKSAEAFEPDVVVVLDHERLFNELQKDLPGFVKICHMPKSGGVEARSQEVRIAARNAAIHRNFYGTRQSAFYPHLFEFSYDKPADEIELQIAKIGAEAVPESLLPVGMKIEDHRTQVVPMPIDQNRKALLNHVLALMPPGSVIDQTLIGKPCIGFLVVTGIDADKKTMTVLTQQPAPLPSKVAMLCDVQFIDED